MMFVGVFFVIITIFLYVLINNPFLMMTGKTIRYIYYFQHAYNIESSIKFITLDALIIKVSKM